MPQNMAQPPTMQRAIMNRHHQARRSNSNIAPKLEPGVPLQSPQLRPTPSSHVSSPTANSPGFSNPGVMTPPASDSQAQHQRLQGPKGLPGNPPLLNTSGVIGPPLGAKPQAGSGPGSASTTPIAAAHYPSPFQNYRNQNFRNHIEQLGKPFLFSCFLYSNIRTPANPPHRTGIRCPSRHGRGPRPHRIRTRALPRTLRATATTAADEPAGTHAPAAARPAEPRPPARRHVAGLRLDGAAHGPVRPDARHGPVWALGEHAVPDAVLL